MQSCNHTPQYFPERNENILPRKITQTWMLAALLSWGPEAFRNPDTHHMLKREKAMHPCGGILRGNGKGADS